MGMRQQRSNFLGTLISRLTPLQRILIILCVLILAAIPLANFMLNYQSTPSATTIAGQLKLTQRAITALPENSAQVRLKKAALLWSSGRVTSELNSGQTDAASNLLNDINAMVKRTPRGRLAAPPNLFPPIPESQSNPFVPHMFDDVQALLKHSDLVAISRAQLQTDTLDAVQALGHPQSPLKDDPRVLTLLLSLLDREFGGWLDKTIGLADFENSNYPVAYAMLQAVYPDLVPPAIRAGWERAILANAQQIEAKFGDIYNNHRSHQTWWNNDIRQAEDLLASGWVVHNEDFVHTAQNAIATLAQNAYQDGAFSYRGLENDSCSYHDDDILYLAWYWLLSDDASARQMLLSARRFYALCHDPRGVSEFYTAPADKHYWNQDQPGNAAYIIAGMTGDGYNATLAGNVPGNEAAAIFYRAALAHRPLPDNYLLYDQNIQGPRGHFGLFSFAGTGRDASVGGQDSVNPNLGMGKSTFVGAMLLDPSASNWPLNAALDSVTSEVQVGAGKVTGINRQNFRSFSQNEHNAVTIAQNFAALSTSYTITDKIRAAGQFTPLQWQGDQQWLFLPDRIIGLLDITSLASQQAYGIDGSFKLISGRNGWGEQKMLQQLDASTMRYGNMMIHIHDQNYGGKLQSDLEATSTIDPADTANKGARILIRDARADGTGELHYSQGESHYYVVEIFPASTSADQVSRLSTRNQLTGVQAQGQGRSIQVITNPTSSNLTYTATLPTPYQNMSIHSSSGMVQTIAVAGGATSVSTSVPAHGNVVIVNSDTVSDHSSGYATAATVFGS
ncbi:MAG: hypothetical protein PVSMB5_02140 [Ktedonobacteraceae bacterium]